MLSGDNGILQRATDAKGKTERAEILENARLDVLSQIAENKGEDITESEFKTILNKYFSDVPSNLPENLSELDLTSISGGYIINAKEIYDGTIRSLDPGLYNVETGELIYDWEELTKPSSTIIGVDSNGVLSRRTFDVGNLIVKLVIGEDVTAIGGMQSISNLQEVIIPNTVTNFNGGFSGCSDLQKIKLSNNMTSIPSGAFGSCTSLNNIDIPESITSIGGGAFQGCTSLTYIKIPRNVTSINGGVFTGCNNLKTAIIEGSETSFSNNSNFQNYFGFNTESLNTVILGSDDIDKGMKIIPNYLFMNFSGIENVIVKNSITSIGHNAFYGCSNLKNLTLSNSLVEIKNSVFSDCVELEKIELPDTLVTIGNFAFQGCTNLNDIKFSEALETIGDSSFKGCSSLTHIEFFTNLETIGWSAFNDCINLKSIYIPRSVSTINSGTFSGSSSSLVIYCEISEENVPSGWNQYWNYNGSSETFSVLWRKNKSRIFICNKPIIEKVEYYLSVPLFRFKSLISTK